MAGDRVLIVDDTPVNLKLTRVLLAHEGFDVRTAADAEQALVVLRHWRPALIVMDIQLPGMDGLELTRLLRRDAAFRHTAIVAVTAYAMKGDEERARASGCDGYITKPIDTRSFPREIRGYLDARRTPPAPAAETGALQPGHSELRQSFLEEGAPEARRLLDSLGPGWDREEAQRTVHRWVGAAALLGCFEVAAAAAEADVLLRDGDESGDEALRESLQALAEAFKGPQE